MQDWNEMQCRLQYMQSQVEEAQGMLAKKVREQEEIEERAAKAEKEKADALDKLEKERAETKLQP